MGVNGMLKKVCGGQRGRGEREKKLHSDSSDMRFSCSSCISPRCALHRNAGGGALQRIENTDKKVAESVILLRHEIRSFFNVSYDIADTRGESSLDLVGTSGNV